jgi:hypothetical protein
MSDEKATTDDIENYENNNHNNNHSDNDDHIKSHRIATLQHTINPSNIATSDLITNSWATAQQLQHIVNHPHHRHQTRLA